MFYGYISIKCDQFFVLENLPDAINSLNDAIKVWHGRTCIRFVPKEESDEHFVTFFRAAG